MLGCGGVEQQELWGDGAGSALQALGTACYQISQPDVFCAK